MRRIRGRGNNSRTHGSCQRQSAGAVLDSSTSGNTQCTIGLIGRHPKSFTVALMTKSTPDMRLGADGALRLPPNGGLGRKQVKCWAETGCEWTEVSLKEGSFFNTRRAGGGRGGRNKCAHAERKCVKKGPVR